MQENRLDNGRLCLLFGADEAELRQLCQKVGLPAYKGGILFKWLQAGEADYNQMTNLSKAERDLLAARYPLALPAVRQEQQSADGSTAKLLLDFGGGVMVELVLMLYQRSHSRSRHTLCISTQAGCAMGCAFCATGLSGLLRNLSAGEIVAQVLCGQLWLRRHNLGPVTNLVLMGMGEPFANYEQVCQALRVLNATAGQNIGQRRITVSTCGLAPQIRRFADEGWEINLARFPCMRRKMSCAPACCRSTGVIRWRSCWRLAITTRKRRTGGLVTNTLCCAGSTTDRSRRRLWPGCWPAVWPMLI